MSDQQPTPAMRESMSLAGDVEALAEYYRRWADDYDRDVTSDGYALPALILETLRATADSDLELAYLHSVDLTIMDAGCGTGLVGAELAATGYQVLDGVDLSPDMVEVARRRGIYRNLYGGVDLTRPVPAHLVASADVVLVAGVFTVGHVPPEALSVMASLAVPGGILITSTRRAYYETSEYQGVSDQLIADGVLDLLLRVDDGPYTMDSTAHYWSYRVK